MAVKIGDVTIRIGASTNELEKDLRKAERALQATAQKFTAIGQNLTLGVTAPVLAAGAAAFKMASDYEESLNKVRVAFGSSSSSVEEFSKTAIDSIGLAEQSALDMAALFGDMATSMGLTRPAAAEMSTSLVQLAGDLSSFKNINIEEVTTALAGVFTGETESLKRLGIVMTEANVQAYALEKGISKKLNTMSQAEKVALRYEYVLNATKNAQGDFARTSDGAANQMRVVSQAVKDLGADFGKILLPVITPLIKNIAESVKSFSNLDDSTKKIIVTIAAVAAAVGPALIVFGQLYKAVGLVGVGWVRFTKLFQAGSLVAAINPVTIAVAAIAAAVYLIYKNWEVVKKSLVDVINYWIELYNQSVAFRGIIQSIVFVFKTIYEAAKTAVNIIIIVFKTAFEYIVNGFKNAGDLITAVLTGNWGKIGDIIKNSFSDAFDTVTKGISEASKLSDDFGRTLEQNFLKGVDAAINPKKIKKITADDILKTTPATTDKTKEKDKPKGTGIADIKIPELETTKKGINDLIPLFKNLQSEATKVTLKKLGNDLSISNVGLNKTAAFLRDVNSEVEAIQVRADRGFITNQQADLEKLEVLKKALQDALQQGLGTGVVDQISQQITELGVTAKPQFDNIFDYLGNKIASIPSIAEKLGKDLKSLGPEISKAIEGSVAAIQQVFSTIGSYFTLQEQNLDAFEEKEKQRIQNSLLGEQQKAEALDKLNEDVLKKRKILARKQAAIDKAQAIFSAVIAGANAVVQALSVPIIGPVLAKVVAGLVAAQIGFISAQPLPSLNVGTDLVKKDGLAMIHKGEAIVPANVVKGGFTGGGGQLTGRLSGIDILISARNSERYLNRIG